MLQGKCLSEQNCSLGAMACRHVSLETIPVLYTELVEDRRTTRLVAGKLMEKKDPIGEFCNNEGRWINKMNFCPIKYAQPCKPHNGTIYPTQKQKWKTNAEGDIKRTQEIIHVGKTKERIITGQQKLF